MPDHKVHNHRPVERRSATRAVAQPLLEAPNELELVGAKIVMPHVL